MTQPSQRPPVRVRFKYNIETGEIEDFIVDDNAPDRSENYHDEVARAFAEPLGRRPEIEDAGRIRYRSVAQGKVTTEEQKTQEEEPDRLQE